MTNKNTANVMSQTLKNARRLADQALEHSNNGDFKGSATLYQQALDCLPTDNALEITNTRAQLHFNLASVLRIAGDLKNARNHFSASLQINQDDAEAWYLRSSVHKATPEAHHLEEIKQRLAQPITEPKLAVHLWYALGKEHEDLEHWQDAKHAIDQGAAIRRQHLEYSVEHDCLIIQRIREVFTSDHFARNEKNQSADTSQTAPLFIVGMPRAGSTLLERIISCSPDVSIAGELSDFSIATTEVIKQAAVSGELKPFLKDTKVTKSKLVELSAHVDAAQIGTRYLERAAGFQGREKFFIDKLPPNYLNIGLIQQAFGSDAKVIHIQRQRDDHIWGIYKHLFNNVYPFSYNLEELNRYYDQYEALMAHWNEVLPDYICNVKYEDLIYEPEATGKRIFEFLGLEWSADYLNFHAVNTAPSATGSAAQVREKLHDRNIGRAKLIFDRNPLPSR